MSWFRALLRVAVGVALLAVACSDLAGGASANAVESRGREQPNRGGIYRAPLLNNPPTLDPAYVQDIYGVAVVQQLFDGLVQFSRDLFVTPALAEDWQVEDGGKTYRFVLRKNAHFHNGRPVTATDAAFSLTRLLRVNPPPTILASLLRIAGARDYAEHKTEKVTGLEVVDDHTLIVRLDETYVPFLIALGMYQAKVVPQEVVEANEQKFASGPVGSGPFRFVSREENKIIRLRSFSDYYGGRPLLDGIDFVIYPGIGVEQVWADFQDGKLDQMRAFGDLKNKLKGRMDLHWMHRPALNLQFYGFNCEHPLLKNPDLRMALSQAIDHEKLVAEAYSGQEEVARGLLPPGLPGYHPHDAGVAEDLAGAIELAKRALGDTPLPVPLEIVSNSQSPQARAELEFVRKAWAPLGIDLQKKFIPDWSQFEQYLKSDAMQIYRYVWFADIPDADDILRPLFSSQSQFNFTRYRDPEVDALLQKALGIVAPVERARLYQEIEERILKSCPVIPLAHLGIDFVYQPTVQGIEVSALGAQTMSFNHVWLKAPSQ